MNKADQFIKQAVLESLSELINEGAIKVDHHILPGEVEKYNILGKPVYSSYILQTSIVFKGPEGEVTPIRYWESTIEPQMFIRDSIKEEYEDNIRERLDQLECVVSSKLGAVECLKVNRSEMETHLQELYTEIQNLKDKWLNYFKENDKPY